MMQNSESSRKTTKSIGDYAEDVACTYLLERGFVPIQRNYRYKQLGEIDLVMRDGDSVVFVEVRYRTSQLYGSPEASIRSGKKQKLRRTAQAFLLTHGMVRQACRFDVIAVDLVGGQPVVRHLVNCL
jgi:putative endonuclease